MTGVVKYNECNKCRQVVERLQREEPVTAPTTQLVLYCVQVMTLKPALIVNRRHNTLSHDLYSTNKLTFFNFCMYTTPHFTNKLPIVRPNDRVKLIVVNVSRNVHQANEVLVTAYLCFPLAYLELRCIRLFYVTEYGVNHNSFTKCSKVWQFFLFAHLRFRLFFVLSPS